MSTLHLMFEAQYDLQLGAFGVNPLELEGDERAIWLGQMLFGMTDEIHEAAEHVGWKAHATSRHFDADEFAGELIDVMHYLLALFIAAGWDAGDVEAAFHQKANEIWRRQMNGHEGRRKR